MFSINMEIYEIPVQVQNLNFFRKPSLEIPKLIKVPALIFMISKTLGNKNF